MPQEDDEASQVDETEVVLGLVLVALGDPAEAEQPGEQALDLPAALVAA
jgi:hypothetical protein